MRRPPLGTLGVVAVAVAVVAVGTAVQAPHAVRRTGQQVEVVGATSVCPDLRQRNNVLASRVSVGAAPLPQSRRGDTGVVEAIPNSRTGAPDRLRVEQPGEVAVNVGTGVTDDALVVSASGELATGLEAEQVTRGESGLERGLAGLRCVLPTTEAWFVGGNTVVGDQTSLVLVNVDDMPATVDLAVYSSDGPVDPRPGQGLTVDPHSRRVVDLDTIAPDKQLLTVHLTCRRGRVAAGLHHSHLSGSVPQGTDWVPQAVPPAQRVVVPGFPQGPGRRRLLVTNPGTDDTVVSVTLTTADGQFVPTGLDQLDVPAGKTVSAPLDAQTAASALSATVVSDGAPVVAGGFVRDGQTGSQIAEFSYTASSLPLSGPALMTDLVISRPVESTLVLTATDEAATVVVTPIRVLGTSDVLPAPKTVRVAAGRTATLRLSTFFKPGADAKLAVEVRPLDGSGPVYAARYLRERGAHGPLTTLLVLQGPAQRVDRPVVSEDLRYAD